MIGARRARSAFSLASRAFTSSMPRIAPATAAAASPASIIQQNMRWSKSSPPSAESPLVASTSNTPRDSLQDRDVEGAAAEIVDRVDAFGRVVEAVGDRGRGRLVQQPQHLQAGEPRRVLGRLALRVVEVGRHGDHRAVQGAAERRLGALAQRAQDLGRDLDRALHAGAGGDAAPCPARRRSDREASRVGEVGKAAAHEALHRDDRVLRIAGLLRLRRVADFDAAVWP